MRQTEARFQIYIDPILVWPLVVLSLRQLLISRKMPSINNTEISYCGLEVRNQHTKFTVLLQSHNRQGVVCGRHQILYIVICIWEESISSKSL